MKLVGSTALKIELTAPDAAGGEAAASSAPFGSKTGDPEFGAGASASDAELSLQETLKKIS